MILIITNKEDVHPTPVIALLKVKNASVFRLNTEALLTDYEFCWCSHLNGTDFWIRNIQNGLEVRGSEITSVWERRPETPSTPAFQNTPEINQHNLKEARGFLQFLRYAIKDIYSIGSIVNDRVAASKMLQLQTAQKVGFITPDTCFSNRKKAILEWAAPHEYIVLKSIENDCVWNDAAGVEYVFYTQKIKADRLAGMPDETFSQTVSYLQNYIEKAYELRITVVGRKVFACKIDSQLLDDDNGKIDWRQGYEHGLKHEVYALPQGISDRCVSFLQQLGLHFGCFDFIVTPAGDFVFLECNPNGQWLWIEDATGLEISKAIAAALIKGND
jgi:glutathione synthase/RimK-type ligase-like ATP-grasp enzyme